MNPQEFFQSMLFTNIIPEALNMSLYASTIDYSKQLKFSLKWMPDVFYPSGKSTYYIDNLMANKILKHRKYCL